MGWGIVVVVVVVVVVVAAAMVVVVVKALTPSSLYSQDHTPSFTRPRLCSAPHSPYPFLQAHRAYTAVERPLGKGLGKCRRNDEGDHLDVNLERTPLTKAHGTRTRDRLLGTDRADGAYRFSPLEAQSSYLYWCCCIWRGKETAYNFS